MPEIYGIHDGSKIQYVGQTTRGIGVRFHEHKVKMGLSDKCSVVLLKECSVDELDKWEIHYIAKYDTLNNGWNKQQGGKSPSGYTIPPRQQSQEERNQRKEWAKKHNPMFSESARKNKSETMKNLYSSGKLPNPNSKEWEIEFDNGRTEKVFALKKWCEKNGYSYRNVYNAFSRNHNHRDIVSVSRK